MVIKTGSSTERDMDRFRHCPANGSFERFSSDAVFPAIRSDSRSALESRTPLSNPTISYTTCHNRSQGDGQAQQQQQSSGVGGSGWIDGGLRDRSGGGFSGLSAEANGFVPSNFTPASGVAGGGEVVGGGTSTASQVGALPCCWCRLCCDRCRRRCCRLVGVSSQRNLV